jgi:AhpD family alkylhydroperoxidase
VSTAQEDAIRLPLPAGDGPAIVRVREHHPAIADAIWDLYKTVTVRGALDPVTSELVRLRCARTNGCRLCQSLRLGDAVRGGLDETLAGKVDDYERSDLSERHKVALRLTDAFITCPDTIDRTHREDLRRWFTDEEVVELLLDVVAWLQQKVLITFALDIPVDPDALTAMDYDAEGNAVLGGVTVA